MRYMDLQWISGACGVSAPLCRVWVIREASATEMRRKAREAFPRFRFGSRFDSALGYFAYLGHGTVDGRRMPFRLICVSGRSRLRRIQIAAHEAMHLALDFWRRRRIPKDSEHSREELACRLMDSLLRFYLDSFEQPRKRQVTS